ncbi:MAG: transposase [Nitrospinae bacterium]|nr:transposase [Nitrospinota bacterium]
MATRRIHSKEFKLEAVRLATQPGASARATAESLGLHASQIRAWKRELSVHTVQAFPGHGRLRADDEEIRKLRLELKRVRDERDILKKATLFFAQESRRK